MHVCLFFLTSVDGKVTDSTQIIKKKLPASIKKETDTLTILQGNFAKKKKQNSEHLGINYHWKVVGN